MSSYLERQREAFAGSLASAASKLSSSTKKPAPPPSPSPSITSTTSAAGAASASTPTPKKPKSDGPPGPPGPPGTIYSQPENTGVGESVLTQMTYVVDWLKGKDDPKTLADVLGHLSATARPEAYQQHLADLLRRNPRIQWQPDPTLTEQTWRSGTYVHRPVIPNVRTPTQLLAYLQRRPDAQGVSVKDLKDGWPGCEAALDVLEREHRVLVVRTKKDNHPRAVWADDPTLCNAVDAEFRALWHKVEVPGTDSIVQRLAAVGQKPTSDDPRSKGARGLLPKIEKKKKRAARRPGKSTNTHMEHLLKDYSHLKR